MEKMLLPGVQKTESAQRHTTDGNVLGEAAKRLGYANENQGLIKVNPNQLPTGYTNSGEPNTSGIECIIRYGQVSIEINSEMSVSKIADLVGALNSHV